jgi:hypothetical protein
MFEQTQVAFCLQIMERIRFYLTKLPRMGLCASNGFPVDYAKNSLQWTINLGGIGHVECNYHINQVNVSGVSHWLQSIFSFTAASTSSRFGRRANGPPPPQLHWCPLGMVCVQN